MDSVDKSSFLPAYHQLVEILRSRIRREFKPGDLIPSQNELIAQYKVSYGTVIRALGELQQEGLITRERGRGTFVTPPTVQSLAVPSSARERSAGSVRSGTIGAVVTRPWDHYAGDPFFKEMMFDLTRASDRAGYGLRWLSSEVAMPTRLTKLVLSSSIDGLIVFNRTELPTEIMHSIVKRWPVVVTDRPGKGEKGALPWVEVDGFAGVRLAMERLYAAGHTRIGLLNGNSELHPAFADRLAAYREFLKEHSIAYRSDWVLDAGDDLSVESGRALTMELIGKDVTAILCAQGRLTIGAIQALQQRGLTIPNGMSLIGYDDDPMFCLMTPGITMVQQPVYEFANQLVQSLDEVVHFGKALEPGRMLQPSLMERGSVAEPSRHEAKRRPVTASRW